MDSMVKVYLQRAKNEISTAQTLYKISAQTNLKKTLEIDPETTYYSATISHAYYAIFYATKAILITNNIETKMPDVHKKTYEEFKKEFIDTGKLDANLLILYTKLIIRADELLHIFKEEKWKRGHFTYNTIPEANKEPAEESIMHATKFLQNIRLVIEKSA